MAEADDARELVAALSDSDDDETLSDSNDDETLSDSDDDAEFFPLNDLPKELLVSVFMAVGDLRWVRHTVPCVCKAWNELYCSKDASPLHETLEVDFDEEGLEESEFYGVFRILRVQASRVISWAKRHAGSVRKLHIKRPEGSPADLSSEDFGALIAAVGPSLTEIRFGFGFADQEQCEKQFWESLRDSVVPAGRLRSLFVEGMESVPLDSDVEPLGQLAGSLEVLELGTVESDDEDEAGLPRFPESFCALKMLRRLILAGHPQITEIPVGISSLKKLEELELSHCGLSSLPKELVELSGLTTLILGGNENLGTTLPAAEAFPAELGKMKSLRYLNLDRCGLRAVPAFVGGLKSLESLSLGSCRLSSLPKELGDFSGLKELYLRSNQNLGNTLPAAEAFPAELGRMKSLRFLNLGACDLRTIPSFVGELESLEELSLSENGGLQIDAPLDFLVDGCPRLRGVDCSGARERTPEARAHLEAFKARLRARNPGAVVYF